MHAGSQRRASEVRSDLSNVPADALCILPKHSLTPAATPYHKPCFSHVLVPVGHGSVAKKNPERCSYMENISKMCKNHTFVEVDNMPV